MNYSTNLEPYTNKPDASAVHVYLREYHRQLFTYRESPSSSSMACALDWHDDLLIAVESRVSGALLCIHNEFWGIDEWADPKPSRSTKSTMRPATRAAVWAKTDGRCVYCGIQTNPFSTFSIDHVVPVSKGGTDDLANLVPCCRSCNSRKGAR